MKQTTMQFEKKVRQPLSLERLQAAVDLIGKTNKATQSLRQVGLSASYTQYLVKARILLRINGHKVEVIKPVLERKDLYRVMDIQTKYLQKCYSKKIALTNYTQLHKAATEMQELLSLSESKIVRTVTPAKPRVRKKAVALPWWKRFLLYLANQ